MNLEYLNRVELRGIVGHNPKICDVGDTQIARFSLATNLSYRDKDGALVEETSWHPITAWKGKNITDFGNIKKGAAMTVIGRIRYIRYTDANGCDRQVTEIIASRVEPYIRAEDGE